MSDSFIPKPRNVTIATKQTSAVGATWVTLTAKPCDAVEIVNTTGTPTAIEYSRDGGTTAITIPANMARYIGGISDASQISIRRVDLSNTQVTVAYETYEG